jgi:Ala-tRNA(Pro) deacylase
MNGDPKLYQLLSDLGIPFEYHGHPPAPTIEEAMKYWKDLDATHCKNLFFRNHKGNKHYLVILKHTRQMGIHELEKQLKQGKLSFASDERMMKYLGVTPGSVTPFGLINDKDHHVHVFLDHNLPDSTTISFHPCINTASLIIKAEDFLRYIEWTTNPYEFITLYDHPEG